jgi:glutamyl-tRNA synthetase
MKERATFLNDLLEQGYYFFEDVKTYDTETLAKKYSKEKRAALDGVTEAINNTSDFTSAGIEKSVKNYLTANNLKVGEVMPILRLALAGTMQGPTVFDMVALFGKEKAVSRLKKSLDYFDTL